MADSLKVKKPIDGTDKKSDNSLTIKSTTKEPEKKEEPKEPVIDDKVKQDWNNYLDWLDKKGMRGKPELDKGGVGNNLFKQYIKENPSTSLTDKHIPGIRKAYLDLRNDRLKEIESGKGTYKGDVSTFMKHIVDNEKSADPNYVGQHLTQTRFPGAKLTTQSGTEKNISLLGQGGANVAAQELKKMK